MNTPATSHRNDTHNTVIAKRLAEIAKEVDSEDITRRRSRRLALKLNLNPLICFIGTSAGSQNLKPAFCLRAKRLSLKRLIRAYREINVFIINED